MVVGVGLCGFDGAADAALGLLFEELAFAAPEWSGRRNEEIFFLFGWRFGVV